MANKIARILLRGRASLYRKAFHTSTWVQISDEKPAQKLQMKELRDNELVSSNIFEAQEQKDHETFRNAIDLFAKRDRNRRGAVEFIQAALKNMKQFGVHRDLETYRAIIDIMPKGKYVPENWWQATFHHYPKHQDCIVSVLTAMVENEVQPDVDMGRLIENIFGIRSEPYKKFMRMIYWMPKFKNLSPFPIPYDLPNETLELAKLAIKQITSIDRKTNITVYDCEELAEAVDKTWIVSGQSLEQKEIITELPKNKALYVEGAFRVWLRDKQVNYFILRGEPVPRPPPNTLDIDDVKKIKIWTLGQFDENDLVKIPNVHEQEDGTILGCCATGTSSKDSLLSWVRFLQRDNPDIKDIPILFTLTSPLGPIVPFEEGEFGKGLQR